MFEELIKIDKELFLYLNNLGTTTWDEFWLYLSKTLSFVTIPMLLLLLFTSYYFFGWKKTIVILVMGLIALFIVEQSSVIVKMSVRRLRPCYDLDIKELMRQVKNYCGGRFSYFSAHAANSSALASFFIILLKDKLKFLTLFLCVWAILVGYSRIYIGVHFPLDVITGFVFGSLFGSLFAWRTLKIIAKY